MIKITRVLLYCNKSKPYLYANISALEEPLKLNDKDAFFTTHNTNNFKRNPLNGKIVAECDFEVEEIKKVNYDCALFTNTLNTEKLINKSCINYFELEKYLKPNWDKEDDLKNLDTVGYAIYIKNLHIFDKPRFIQDYSKNENPYNYIENAPQNMMYAYDVKSFNNFEKKVLISIHPEWLCKILNGEKTIEVRKKVLKEML